MPDGLYVAETGHFVSPRFSAFYTRHGGSAVFGNPLPPGVTGIGRDPTPYPGSSSWSRRYAATSTSTRGSRWSSTSSARRCAAGISSAAFRSQFLRPWCSWLSPAFSKLTPCGTSG